VWFCVIVVFDIFKDADTGEEEEEVHGGGVEGWGWVL
jgi:hypothetical protein